MKGIHLIGVLAAASACLMVVPGCAKKPADAGASSAVAMPKRWSDLRLPTDGLQQLLPRTNDHQLYADYSGGDDAALWEKVSVALGKVGYAPACSLFEGRVRGFAKGGDKLAAKVDSVAGTLALAIFDDHGTEALLHGACFGKFKLGPPQQIK